MSEANHHHYDAIVVGSGAAGLTTALHLSENDYHVVVLSKGPLSEGSTLYAQGGISAVLDADDSIESHVSDTLAAGAGLCSEETVRFTVERSKHVIEWLIARGVDFTPADKDADYPYHLTREGGHSHRRIIHADDTTGKAVETTLAGLAHAEPRITILEYHTAVDVITGQQPGEKNARCLGMYALNTKSGHVDTLSARTVLLATGGANLAYLYSSNPHAASGDGIAMAWRAGCRVANMEFMQFHPTCLFHPEARSFLISEAVRGEGGKLLRPDGTRFMPNYHPQAELAPRDVVARAIDAEMKRLGLDHVWLDISHRDADFIREHFPGIHQHCRELGLDMTREPLPVVPAAHYTCGGVVTDLNGRSDLPGLYAIGETAFTGLHGANRLASNSLLECLVFANAAANAVTEDIQKIPRTGPLPDWDESRVTDSDEEVIVTHNWQELRRFMWDYVGIVRTTKRLERAQHRVDLLRREIHDYYGSFRITSPLIELRNLALVSDLIIQSALQRRESRGLHYTLDYPDALPAAAHNILTPPATSADMPTSLVR